MCVRACVRACVCVCVCVNSSFYKNEPLKGTDFLQKSFDGIFILPDKLSFMSRALLCLQPLPEKIYISDIPKAPHTQ